MTGERAVRTVQLVGATALITSVFWLLMGALVWPYATVSGEIAFPDRFARDAADPSALDGGTAAPLVTTVQARAGQGGERQLIIPVAGVGPQALIDTYSQARDEGIRQHDAIDIPAREGTPVVAAAAGTVEKLFRSESGGNTIYVRSRDGRVMFYYAHLQGYAPGLAEGQVVRPGDALGAVGWTGNAEVSAPHLHFAMWEIVPEARWWEITDAMNPYPLLQAETY